MNWSDLAPTVGQFAPVLGTLLGGPAGAAVGGIIASVLGCDHSAESINAAVLANPDAAVKLKQIESDQRIKLNELLVTAEANRLTAETNQLAAVNATMQAEAKADHWPTYTWRPFNGFIVGTMAFGCYFVLPLLKLPVPAIPESVWLMFGAILGVASWFRGKAQADQTTDKRG